MIPFYSLKNIYDFKYLSGLINLKNEENNQNEDIKNFLESLGINRDFILFNSGRSALFFLLKYCLTDIKYVLLQPYTCDVVIQSILNANKKIIFFDIELDTYGLQKIEIPSYCMGRSAMIITHLYGCPSKNTFFLKEIAHDKDLILIEDAAQSYGSFLKSKPLGTIGDYSILSFDYTKPLPLGFGGLLLFNKDAKIKEITNMRTNYDLKTYYKKLLLLLFSIFGTSNRNIYGILSHIRKMTKHIDIKITIPDKANIKEYYFQCPYNITFNNHVVNMFKKYTKKRNSLYLHYNKLFNEFNLQPYFRILNPAPESFINCIRYPLLINNKSKIINKLFKKGIDVGFWYDDDLIEKYKYSKLVNFGSPLKNSKKAFSSIINLPLHVDLSYSDQVYIVQCLKKAVEK